MRKIFNFNKYTRDARLTNAINFSKFSEFSPNNELYKIEIYSNIKLNSVCVNEIQFRVC